MPAPTDSEMESDPFLLLQDSIISWYEEYTVQLCSY